MKMSFYATVLALLLGPQLFALSPADEPTVKVVAKVRPSIVNIYTESVIEQAVHSPMDNFFEQFFGGGYIPRGGRLMQHPVTNLGSGMLVDPSGYVVTNQHVLERAKKFKIKVTLDDGTDYEAQVIREDLELDLALIKITREKPFPAFDLKNLSPNLLGETVIAIGNPVGYESSVSQGILSARNRSIVVDGFRMEGLLQVDAAINPGNSGGPLVDIAGNLVGLNSAKMATTQSVMVENIGFAIPGDRVKAWVEDAVAIAKGQKPAPPEEPLANILRKRFGFQLQELTPKLATSLGLEEVQGILISGVDDGSPASDIGAQSGMVITYIGGVRTRTIDDLPRELVRVKKEDTVRFQIILTTDWGGRTIRRSVGADIKAR